MRFRNIGLLLFILLFSSLIAKETLKYKPLVIKPESFKGKTDIKVLALRAEFIEDSIKTTTGNGKFNSEYPDTLKLGKTPHDKQYFIDHLTFVKNYYEKVSDGAVTFSELTVLDTIVTLPHQMWWYNRNLDDDGDDLDMRLKMLQQHAWEQVASNQNIDFSRYDVFVVYHAGSGQEFSTEIDETPHDIPSVYLNSSELADYTVTTHDGTDINSVIILPESEWQRFDGGWYFAALQGTSVFMFGYSLGTTNLHSSKDNASGIGRFGLMDQGSGNFSGLLPAKPSAFTRELLGWTNIITPEPSPEDTLSIEAGGDIYRIDINSNEYYLIENRLSHTARPDTVTYGYDRNGKQIKLWFDKNYRQGFTVDEGFKVMVDADDFDFALPASGIFVWHVDKTIATEENIAKNKVNYEHDNRGVYLKEADGSYDIGETYSLLQAGYGTELGWTYDAFFDSNTVWQDYSNKDLYKNNKYIEFSSKSYPSSNDNFDRKTGIKLRNFSNPGEVMTFIYEKESSITDTVIDPELNDAFQVVTIDSENPKTIYTATNGNIKVYENGEFIEEVSIGNLSNYKPVVFDKYILFVKSGNIDVILLDIENMVFSTYVTGEIVSQPRYNTINTVNGFKYFQIFDTEPFPVLSDKFLNLENIYDFAVSQSGDIHYMTVTRDGELVICEDLSVVNTISNNNINENTKNYLISTPDGYNHVLVTGNTIITLDNTGNIESQVTYDGTFAGLFSADNDEGTGAEQYEYFIYKDGILTAYNLNGTPAEDFRISLIKGGQKVPAITKTENFMYIKGDNKLNIFVISDDGYLYKSEYSMLNRNYFTENYWLPYYNFKQMSLLPTMDNQTSFELLTTEDKIVRVETDSPWDNVYAIKYSSFVNNAINNYYPLIEANTSQSGRLVEKQPYNWPNPAKGNHTNFRFSINEPATIEINIYDINGDRIAKLNQSAEKNNEDFDLRWNLSDVSSGVYIAKIKVSGAGKSEKYTIKVAVTK